MKNTVLALLISAALPALASAQDVPQRIAFQGRLTTSGGQPLNGPNNLTFSIYNVPSGGSPIWTETHTGYNVQNGKVELELGSSNPVSYAIAAGPDAFLGVQVNSDAEMTPRQRLGSVAYAFKAREVGDVVLVSTIAGKPSAGGITLTSATVVAGPLTVSDNSLGITGTGSLVSAGAGEIFMEKNADFSIAMRHTGGGLDQKSWGISNILGGSGGELRIRPVNDAGNTVQANALTLLRNGSVGVNKLGPTATLDVAGSGAFTGPLTVGGLNVLTSTMGASLSAPNTFTSSQTAVLATSGLGWGHRVAAVEVATFVEGSLQHAGFGTVSSHQLRLFTNGSANPVVYVTTDTKVGIGTSNPAVELDVIGRIRSRSPSAELAAINTLATAGDTGSARVLLMPQAGGGAVTQQDIVGVDGALSLRTGGIPGSQVTLERLRIDNLGRVAIGNAAPAARLHVSSGRVTGLESVLTASSGTSAGQELLQVRTDGLVSVPGSLTVGSTTVTGNLHASAGTFSTPSITFSGNAGSGLYSPSVGHLALVVNGAGEAIHITDTAQIGMGTAGPSVGVKLEVQGGSIKTTSGVEASTGVFATSLTVGGSNVLTAASGVALLGAPNTFTQSQTVTFGISAATATIGSALLGPSLTPYAFASETNTGMILSAPGDLGLKVAGATNLHVTSEGASISVGGSAAAPSFRINSANSGMFMGGANTVRFATNGVERLSMLDNGNVGIGSTTPGTMLDVAGGVKASTVQITTSLDVGGFAQFGSGATKSTMTAAGDIQVGNVIKLGGTLSTTIDATAFQNTSGGVNLDGSTGVTFKIGGSPKVEIASSGNVGINSTSPTTMLDVVGGVKASTVQVTTSLSVTASTLVFVNGNIGIGTNNPQHFLDVQGNIQFAYLNAETSGPGFEEAALRLATPDGFWLLFEDGSNYNDAPQNSIGFWSEDASTTTLVLMETGQVGVGTGLAIPARKLDVNGGAIVRSSLTVTGSGIAGANLVFEVVGDTLAVLANGLVGIGTNNPSAKLDVKGSPTDVVGVRVSSTGVAAVWQVRSDNGHMEVFGAPPTLTGGGSCTGGSVSVDPGSTDVAGSVTATALAGQPCSLVLAFRTPYVNSPFCVASGYNAAQPVTAATTASDITVTVTATTTRFTYVCIGR